MSNSYVNTTQRVKLSIDSADFSANLINGTVTDTDFSASNVVYTSGSIELGGNYNGKSILDHKFKLGSKVLITSIFGQFSALHPRGTLFVINQQKNFNDATVTLEVACRLSILKDFGENNNTQIRNFIEQIKGKDKDLTLCDINKFDITSFESIAEATGYAAYMDGTDQLKLTPRFDLLDNSVTFTSFLDKSAISVEDLSTVLIPPSTIKLEQEFETPGYPEEDPEDRDDDPESCFNDNDCPQGFLCIDGFCVELECKVDSQCPPYAECVDGKCEAITCNDEKVNALRQKIDAETSRLNLLDSNSDTYASIENRIQVLAGQLRIQIDSTVCPEGTICVNGKCTDGYCQQDIDCAKNHFCVDGQCTKVSCINTPDCPSGYSCFGGVCKIGDCFVDKDCRTKNNGECVDGECTVFECSVSSDCSAGYACVDRECLLLPDLCNDDTDCGEGEVCVRGQCVPEAQCSIDSDCEDGFVCVDGNCVESEEEEEEEEPDPEEVLSDVTNLLSTALIPKPFSELFEIKKGKYFKKEEDRTTIHSCGKHINPLYITARAKQAAAVADDSAACFTEISDQGEEGDKDEYVFSIEGSFEFKDVFFEDKIIKRQEVTYKGPGRQQDYEKTYEIMSAWRANDSNIRAYLDTYVQNLQKLIEEANQIGEEVSEYLEMRDENNKDALDVLTTCLDAKTKLMLDKAYGFYECLAANSILRFEKRLRRIRALYDHIKEICQNFSGQRVTTNIDETKRTFGPSGEVIRQEKTSYVHGGSSKVVTDYIKNEGQVLFNFDSFGNAYNILSTVDQNAFWTNDSFYIDIDRYEVESKKAASIDIYEYYVGHVKHTNKKIDYENPLNNTTQIVISTDNSVASQAPPSQRSYLDSLDTDLDGIINTEDDDDDNDGILDTNDPNPLIPDDDTDEDGIADVNDDDIDGDDVPNELDPSPYRDDSDGPDSDGDGIPNILDDDIDGDGFANENDPDVDGDLVPNHLDYDVDGDGYSNSADPDADGDGIINSEDPNINNSSEDMDGDGTPDATDDDIDGDGLSNDDDPSPTDFDYDTDGDGLYDFEDGDDDGDGIADNNDPQPLIPERDLDQDGVVDSLDSDIDGDNIPNADDPMPEFPNTRDVDGDGTPDIIDPDIDDDGIPNAQDPRPTIADQELDVDLDDIDGDGIPNNEDPDADGDGVPAYADVDDLNADAQFEPGRELTPCRLTTENYTIEMKITIEGNSKSIAGVTVGGEETIEFPLEFLPLVPENMTAQIEDEAGDPMWMAGQTCNELSIQFQDVAVTRLERIERLMAKYFKYYTDRLVMSGKTIRIVESMRPELYMWRPGLNVRVVSNGKSQGNYYIASTTWGFDPSNMICSMDLVGY